MKLAKYRTAARELGIGRIDDDRLIPLDLSGGHYNSLFDILEADDPLEVAEFLTDRRATPIPWVNAQLLAPIDQQEVWAAGVTYIRSKTARMEESTAAASCYDRVYNSPRPELFFKASPHRVAGPDEPLRIRKDAQWNVPEPEFTLVLNSRLQIVGYTIGNDMSSRDIEGENPLYLPQAKVYNSCCGLGPCITLAPAGALPSPEEITIEMTVSRDGKTIFQGQTDLAKLARKPDDLVQWLARDNSFPTGAFLLTGTGIVPDNLFTLLPGDVVRISIEGVGTLSNPVIQG